MYHGVQLKPQALLKEVRRGKFSNLIKTIDSVGLSGREEWRNGYHLLQAAVKYLEVDEVRYLLDKGATVNYQSSDRSDPNDSSPLHIAIDELNYEIINWLSNQPSSFVGYTPLHKDAARSGYFITSLLLHRGAYVNSVNSLGQTPLAVLCRKGDNVESAKILLQFGADVNKSDNNNETPIIFATQRRRKELFQLLLDNGANIEDRSRYGCTPLHLSVMNNELEMVQILLSRGAKIDALDSEQQTPLFCAVYNQVQDEIVELELKYGADVNKNYRKHSPYCNDPLNQALSRKDWEIMRLLLENGCNVNSINKRGETALHHANSVDTIRILLQFGANINARCHRGATPLCKAVRSDNFDATSFLIAQGADVNLPSSNGTKPIHMAVKSANMDIVDFLLKNGALVDDLQGDGKTLLHLAVVGNCPTIAKILVKNHCDIELQDNRGYTCLQYAVHYARADILELLLSVGADINVETPDGKTLLDLATSDRTDPSYYYDSCVSRTLSRHISKLHSARIHVSKKNLDKIIAFKGVSVDNEWNLEFQRERYSSVVEELEALENTRLCGSISLYNILRETSTKYVSNAALMEALKLVEFEKFTRYGELIVNKIERDGWRHKLLQTASVNFLGLSRLGKKADLPQEMIDIILSHLRNRDLTNLNSCYNRLEQHIKDSLSFQAV